MPARGKLVRLWLVFLETQHRDLLAWVSSNMPKAPALPPNRPLLPTSFMAWVRARRRRWLALEPGRRALPCRVPRQTWPLANCLSRPSRHWIRLRITSSSSSSPTPSRPPSSWRTLQKALALCPVRRLRQPSPAPCWLAAVWPKTMPLAGPHPARAALLARSICMRVLRMAADRRFRVFPRQIWAHYCRLSPKCLGHLANRVATLAVCRVRHLGAFLRLICPCPIWPSLARCKGSNRSLNN